MNIGTIIIIIVVGVLLILVFYAIGVYNNLINARNKAKDQFSQIDVQLKRRSDMIPNLVETVKGYAKHEEKTLKEVVEARNKMATASGINEEVEASNAVTSALNKLFALSEAYPELKANENFMSLQADLKVKNNDVVVASIQLSNARIARNEILYKPLTGLIDVAFDFKVYIKSVFGATSPQYKQISKLKFVDKKD